MKEAVDNSRFLRLLAEFYDQSAEKGSVWLTLKQSKFVALEQIGISHAYVSVPGEATGGAATKLCLVRAKIDKKHEKNSIHTFVKPQNVVAFSEELNALMYEKCAF